MSMMMIPQLEQWILQSNDPSQPVVQWHATRQLQEWSTDSCHDSQETLLHLANSHTHPAIPLFAYNCLALKLKLPPDHNNNCWPRTARQQLRDHLLYHHTHHSTVSTDHNNNHVVAAYQGPLRNKRAWLLTALIWYDVPDDNWTTIHHDLIHHLSVQEPDMFLKTMETLLEDAAIVHQDGTIDSTTCQRVKEYFCRSKGTNNTTNAVVTTNNSSSSSSSLLQCLLERVVQLLQQALMEMTTSDSTVSDSTATTTTATLALATLQRFFVWINPTTMTTTIAVALQQTLLSCMNATTAPTLIKGACQVWQEWACVVDMQQQPNWSLPVLERIHQSNLLPYTGSSSSCTTTTDMEVVIQVAKLINTIGLHCSGDTPNNNNDTGGVVNHQVMDLFFRAFAFDDIDVSMAVLPLATHLSNHHHDHNNFLPRLLQTLYQQLKYPDDFDYNYQNDADAEEILYRTELSKLFCKLVRVDPEMCLQFLSEAATLQFNNNNNLSRAPTADIQAFLQLLYHYCEGIRPPPGLKTVMTNETFCAILVALHGSDISQHPHVEVLCLYYETAVRYYPIFLLQDQNGQLLARVLSAMSGIQGLQHAHDRVRSRCCYLLLRLVKSVIQLLRPVVETAVSGIHNLLTSSTTTTLRPDDTLYLCETMGLLLGKTGLDAVDQQRYLTQVMTPHVQSIQERLLLLAANDPHAADLANSIAAMAHLSKGFSRKPPEPVQLVFVQAVQITLTVLQALASHEVVRNKSMVLLQRMILCIGTKVLEYMAQFLFLLIEHCTEEDILFVSQLMNQLCIKFKEKAVSVLDASLLYFLRKCTSLVPATVNHVAAAANNNGMMIPPHLPTEQLSIQKLAFVVLQHVVSNNVDQVLVSPTNAASLESILRIMSDGACFVQDAVVQKTCLRFFRELLEKWCPQDENGPPSVYQRGLVTFCTEHVVPGTLACLLGPSFDQRDAAQARVIQEYSHVLWWTLQQQQQEPSAITNRIMMSVVPQPTLLLAALQVAQSPAEVQQWLCQLLEELKRTQHVA